MPVRLTDQERERRSKAARRLLAEGKLGSSPNAGRPSQLRTRLAIEVANVIGGKELSEAKILALRDILRLAVTSTEAELLVAGRVLAQLLASVTPDQTLPKDPAGRAGA